MTVLYSPSDVQKLLGIDSSTLRKYATLLEGNGYHIHRNNRGHRNYYDKDVNTFRQLIEFSQQEGMTMEMAAKEVLPLVSQEFETTNYRDIEQDANFDELIERIEHLERINLDLIKHLKEKTVREAFLEEKINHIYKFVERLEQLEAERRILEETRLQIAAGSQKKWWKWWKK